MKQSIVALTIVLTLASALIARAEGRSENELMELYKAYHAAKDLENMMGLFYTNGTPQSILEIHRKDREQNLALKITSAKIEPVPDDTKARDMKGYPYQGKTLVPNLEPIKQLVVTFDESSQGDAKTTGETIMIGKNGDTHYFVMSKFKTE